MAATRRTSVFVAPKKRVLASAGIDGTVKIWSVGKSKPLRVLTAGSGAVRALAFSPDGRILATASTGEVRLWSMNKKSAPATVLRHESTAKAYSLAFIDKGKRLLVGGADCLAVCDL